MVADDDDRVVFGWTVRCARLLDNSIGAEGCTALANALHLVPSLKVLLYVGKRASNQVPMAPMPISALLQVLSIPHCSTIQPARWCVRMVDRAWCQAERELHWTSRLRCVGKCSWSLAVTDVLGVRWRLEFGVHSCMGG